MDRDEILEGLAPLFKRARREKLLFRSHYQHVIFTPDELEETQKKGSFRWGAVNWELVSAKDIREDKVRAVDRATKELIEFEGKYAEYL